MSEPFNPERRSHEGGQESKHRLKVDHHRILYDQVLKQLQAMRAEGDRIVPFNNFLGQLLGLEMRDWYADPTTIIGIYQEKFTKANPNFKQEFRRGVATTPHEINPAYLLPRVMAVLVALTQEKRIKFLETDAEKDYMSGASGFYIMFLSIDEDTRDMEPFDLDAYLLDEAPPTLNEKQEPFNPDDTQPSRPIR